MKIITFNLEGPKNISRLNILYLSPDFCYFKDIDFKSHREPILSWYHYEYTIKDKLANFLKIKYPDLVNIKDPE